MILGDFLKALGQIGDPRFRRVLVLGVALSLALLAAVYGLFVLAIQLLVPDSFTLPFIGEVGGIDAILSWASAFLMIGLSVFLMVPVASAFVGLFQEEIADAVEARHYPGLPPVPRIPLAEVLRDALAFFAIVVVANLLLLVVYFAAGPLAPLLFWAVNGYLLGREYFQMAAMRRLGRAGARALRRRYSLRIWLAGVLMAAPLSVPLVNLVVPILGAATFTHLFHRLRARAEAGSSSRNP